MIRRLTNLEVVLWASVLFAACARASADSEVESRVRGWLGWRGPDQSGASQEKALPEDLDGSLLWTHDLHGRATPVTAQGRVYVLGYRGEGPALREVVACLDEGDGREIWSHSFADFLSDTIYDRYSLGSPAVDPETLNVYVLTSPGLLVAIGSNGEKLWERSLMEEFGRLTFPNGRTGGPVFDGDRVIVHPITSGWGAEAAARDRFLAFDKRTGETIWSSAPGEAPLDNSFSQPVLVWEDGRRVLYAGTGCGHLACLDARTGEALWRFPMTIGGINASALLFGETVIAIHGTENIDSSSVGRMVAIRRGPAPSAAEGSVPILGADREVWRADLESFSSSPVLVGDRIYLTVRSGELVSVNATNGAVLWHHKLGSDQIHASPAWGDGKLYVPMNSGTFYVVRPRDEGPEVLDEMALGGNCLGAPAISDGRVYVHTTEKLFCFGRADGERSPAWPEAATPGAAGDAVRLQIVPSDVLARPGDHVPLRGRTLDASGAVIAAVEDLRGAKDWARVPPGGAVVIPSDVSPEASAKDVTGANLSAPLRLRIVPNLPFVYDFESVELSQAHKEEADVKFAPAPAHWVGAQLKWEVREREGDKVLAKTIDRALFQRTQTFIGHPDSSAYTMTIDVLSDGTRRTMSSPGLINQRYLVQLKGNHQQIEISSNHERLKEAVPFAWRPETWYRLKSRVDVSDDGTATVRAKAWVRDEPEPEAWTIEVVHPDGHRRGAPGVYGFTPQSRVRVYIDNISIVPND